jgi:Flp pilus assembly protein TadG
VATLKKNARGLAAVEAAILLPVVLLLVFGMIEYGWMFLKAQQVQGAARSGCRVAIRETASNTNVTTAIQTTMTNGGLGLSGYTVALSPSNVALALPGENVSVTVTVPYQGGIWLTHIPFIPVPTNLHSTATMAKEGPAGSP